jgi:hypothetical protein
MRSAQISKVSESIN